VGRGMTMSGFWLPELETKPLCQSKEPFVPELLTAPRELMLALWHQIFSNVTKQFGKLVLNMKMSIKQKRTIY